MRWRTAFDPRQHSKRRGPRHLPAQRAVNDGVAQAKWPPVNSERLKPRPSMSLRRNGDPVASTGDGCCLFIHPGPAEIYANAYFLWFLIITPDLNYKYKPKNGCIFNIISEYQIMNIFIFQDSQQEDLLSPIYGCATRRRRAQCPSFRSAAIFPDARLATVRSDVFPPR